jgi:hypothetical protein
MAVVTSDAERPLPDARRTIDGLRAMRALSAEA